MVSSSEAFALVSPPSLINLFFTWILVLNRFSGVFCVRCSLGESLLLLLLLLFISEGFSLHRVLGPVVRLGCADAVTHQADDTQRKPEEEAAEQRRTAEHGLSRETDTFNGLFI